MAKMLYISEMYVHFRNVQFVLGHVEFYIAYIIKLPIDALPSFKMIRKSLPIERILLC